MIKFFKAIVKDVKDTYIELEIPELKVRSIYVKDLLMPVFGDEGIYYPSFHKGQKVIVSLDYIGGVYSDPVILPFASVSLQKSKEMKLKASDKVYVESNKILLQKSGNRLTPAVRYDILLQYIQKLYQFLLTHNHIVSPTVITSGLDPTSLTKVNLDLNPMTSVYGAKVLRQALKSDVVELE